MNDGKAGFARRLNEALDQLDIPAKQHGRFTALSRLFSVSPTAARDWCEGKSYPSVDKLLLIMDTVRCDADWLLFGRRTDAGAADPRATDERAVSAGRYRAETDRAGLAAGAADAGCEGSVPGRPGGRGAAGDVEWVAVSGDAMAPTLLPGDHVGVEHWQGGVLSDGIYALHAPGTSGGFPAGAPGLLLLRRVLRLLDGDVELSCDNPLCQERGHFREQPAGQLTGVSHGAHVLVVWGRVVQRRHALP